MDAQAQIRSDTRRPYGIDSLTFQTGWFHAQCAHRHVHACEHIQLPRQTCLYLTMRCGRRQPPHHREAKHHRSEHKQAPTPALVRNEMRTEFRIYQMIGPERFSKRSFGHTKHHLSSFLMALEGNAFLITPLLKTLGVLRFTKDKHVISRVAWVRVMVDPPHQTVGLRSCLAIASSLVFQRVTNSNGQR